MVQHPRAHFLEAIWGLPALVCDLCLLSPIGGADLTLSAEFQQCRGTGPVGCFHDQCHSGMLSRGESRDLPKLRP